MICRSQILRWLFKILTYTYNIYSRTNRKVFLVAASSMFQGFINTILLNNSISIL